VQGIGAGGLWIGTAFAILERYPGEEYKRLTAILAAYGLGAIAGPAIGGIGGISGPFLLHLVLVTVLTVALVAIGAPKNIAKFGSDRAALRSPGFLLASAGILMVALTLGTFDGPMPLHFGEQLSQAEIAALYVLAAIVSSGAAALAGRRPPRLMLAVATVLMTLSIALGGATEMIGLWVVVAVLCGLGLGTGEAGLPRRPPRVDRTRPDRSGHGRLVAGLGDRVSRGAGDRRRRRRGVRLRGLGARAARRQRVRLRRVRQGPL
jgi:MFS family permease